MPMYKLIEYSGNYSDTSWSFWQFKRDEIEGNDNLTRNSVKIVVPLRYLNNFWSSLEIPLIHCKVELSLKWYKNCMFSSAGDNATFTITDANLVLMFQLLLYQQKAMQNYQNY